jgi:hypothetical protein
MQGAYQGDFNRHISLIINDLRIVIRIARGLERFAIGTFLSRFWDTTSVFHLAHKMQKLTHPDSTFSISSLQTPPRAFFVYDKKQTPNPKHQGITNDQSPNARARAWNLKFGAWNFPGVWGLEFGAFTASTASSFPSSARIAHTLLLRRSNRPEINPEAHRPSVAFPVSSRSG